MGALAIPAALSVGATVFSAAGSLFAGRAAKKSADREAALLMHKASTRRGEANAAARNERREGRLVQSRAQAVAAASGAGGADPTVVNLQGDIEAESEYRALARLYEGESEAQSLQAAAGIRQGEGRAAFLSGGLGAVTSVLSGMESLRSKYG